MWPADWVFRIAIMGKCSERYYLSLHLSRPMLMPVVDIGHVIVFMLFCGMLVLVGMCACCGRIMIVSGVVMSMAVLMQQDRMHMQMRVLLIDKQERAADHQYPCKNIRNGR